MIKNAFLSNTDNAPASPCKRLPVTPLRVKQITTVLDDCVCTPDYAVVEGEIEQGKRYAEESFSLRYRNCLSDGVADLGSPAEISGCFCDFQRCRRRDLLRMIRKTGAYVII